VADSGSVFFTCDLYKFLCNKRSCHRSSKEIFVLIYGACLYTGNNVIITELIGNILDIELLAVDFLELMMKHPTQEFLQRFKLTESDIKDKSGYDMLAVVGRKRGMLISGGEIDTERAATLVMDEYRDGKFGNITLEYPGE
jgi:ribosome biogenesis GTPase A